MEPTRGLEASSGASGLRVALKVGKGRASSGLWRVGERSSVSSPKNGVCSFILRCRQIPEAVEVQVVSRLGVAG